MKRCDRVFQCRFHPAAHAHRVGPHRGATHPLRDERLEEDHCGRRPVAGDVVGLRGDFLHYLGAHVLHLVGKRDVFGDRDAVVGNRRCTIAFIEDHIASARTDGDLHGVCHFVDTALECLAGLFSS